MERAAEQREKACFTGSFHSNMLMQSRHDCDGSASARLWKADRKDFVCLDAGFRNAGNSSLRGISVAHLPCGNFHESCVPRNEEFFAVKKHKRLSIYQRDGYKCWYCGTEIVVCDGTINSRTGALDHKTPVKKGGTNSADNLVCCCWACNSRKSDKTVEEYRNYCFYNLYPTGKTITLLEEAVNYAPEAEQQSIRQLLDRLWSTAEPFVFFGEVSNVS